jgi:pimeloyl-ACP methyl ester carboxylesterase
MSKPIYILHGWAIDQLNDQKWQPFIRQLNKTGTKSQFLKLPGLSSPLNEVWELDDYAKWLNSQLPSGSVTLLGHSFGGQLAIRFTHLYPKKVSKLILIASAGIIDKRIHKVIKRKLFWAISKIGKPFFKAPIFRKLLYKIIREGDYQNAPPLMRKVMQGVINQEVTADSKTIDKPTLIIWGAQDQVTPLFMGHKYHTLIKQSVLKIINSARHSPQFTHPQQTAAAVTTFLKESK